MGAFLTVGSKVGVMLIMIFVGWIITKKGILSEKGAGEFTWILLNIVTPCLIVSSFLSVERGGVSFWDLGLAALAAAAAIGIGIAVSLLFFKKEVPERRQVLRFAMIFSNSGFMGMPLIQGIVGEKGVIYGSFFIAVFNLICWTYGYSMMSGGSKLRLGKILLNPGTLGLAIGLPIYLCGIQLPEIITGPIEGFSGLNTPLAMMVVGTYIAKVKLKEIFSDPQLYLTALLRLLILPALLVGILCIVRPNETLFMSTAIQACAPAAANCVLFAAMFGADAKLASKAVASTTVLSILTMPLFIVFCQFLVQLCL